MTEKYTLRILKELQNIKCNPDHQFFLSFKEDNVKYVKSLIIGTPGTPYAFGMFNFAFTFSSQYPTLPPEVLCETTNNKTTRFNPNIYSSGMLCISLLGTWKGKQNEQWSSAHGILSLLISIQSLLCENPFHNEPGFENDTNNRNSDLISAYNRKIMHETLRISVCDRLESYYKATTSHINCPFEDPCKYLFACYYYRYLDIIDTESQHVARSPNFAMMPFESYGNSMEGTFNYPLLRERIESIYAAYQKETLDWKTKSEVWADSQCSVHSYLTDQFKQIRSHKDFSGSLDIELRNGNPYVWYISIFGRPATVYEDGIFHLEVVFHNTYPDRRPRIKICSPFFHPNVSDDGIVYYLSSQLEDLHSILKTTLNLFIKDPETDPVTHLNKKAAKLFFGSRDEKREYSMLARRCAAKSLE